ncbi:unnamed protein product, partial [Heterosigma akashiwo]
MIKGGAPGSGSFCTGAAQAELCQEWGWGTFRKAVRGGVRVPGGDERPRGPLPRHARRVPGRAG